MLYEMLTTRPAFDGKDVHRQIIAIQEHNPLPLSRFHPGLPERLQEIVSKTLAKKPDDRYQTAKDLLIDLKSLQRRLEIDAAIEDRSVPELMDPGDETNKSDNQHRYPAAMPQGEQGTPLSGGQRASSAEYLVTGISRHKTAAGIAVAVLLIAGMTFAYSNFWRSSPGRIDSLAILPFVNASGDPEAEYFSDGVTESIINSLSQVPGLRVMARSTVFRFKGRENDPQAAGKELGVNAVLTGRILQRNNDLLISVELLNVSDGRSLWGSQYNRKSSAIFTVQDEITRDVSRKLQANLSGRDEQKLAKNYTENVEAYQLYLRGRYHTYKLTPSDAQKGIEYFRKAIELDPSYALAYVGMSENYRTAVLSGDMPAHDFFPKSKAAAMKAIEIDDNLAEAHAALGFAIFWYDWDWEAAENEYKRALKLNPNSAIAHSAYAHLLSSSGQHEEALAEIKRARELDPLSPYTNALEGQFLLHAGKPDEALARLEKTFELAPDFWLAHVFASSAYIEKGMFAEGIAEARKAKELSGVSSQPAAFMGYALAMSGKNGEARVILNELRTVSKLRYIPPYNIAMIYKGLGEHDETIAWLNKGLADRDARMIFLKVDPKWNSLRGDPRFRDIIKKVGFPR